MDSNVILLRGINTELEKISEELKKMNEIQEMKANAELELVKIVKDMMEVCYGYKK